MKVAVSSKKETGKLLSRYEPFYKDNISLITTTLKGLKPEAVFDFISLSDLPIDLVETILNKSLKTFQNYRTKNLLLDATTSEKILKLFALYKEGLEVFGSVAEFAEWLAKPAYGLGSKVPQDLLVTMTGIDLVYEELMRIEYGDLG